MPSMSEFTSPEPTIKEFRDEFEKVAQDCTVDGVMSTPHEIMSSVTVWDTDGNQYKLLDIGQDQLMGCGCGVGVEIYIEALKGVASEL